MTMYVVWKEHREGDKTGIIGKGVYQLDDIFPYLVNGYKLEAVVRNNKEMKQVIYEVLERIGYEDIDDDNLKIWIGKE